MGEFTNNVKRIKAAEGVVLEELKEEEVFLRELYSSIKSAIDSMKDKWMSNEQITNVIVSSDIEAFVNDLGELKKVVNERDVDSAIAQIKSLNGEIKRMKDIGERTFEICSRISGILTSTILKALQSRFGSLEHSRQAIGAK